MSDDIAREFIEAAGGDLTAAVLRMASTIEKARARAEDALPNKGMGFRKLALLWADLHPNPSPEAKEWAVRRATELGLN